jgi:phospholipid transport system substrate-binding protein
MKRMSILKIKAQSTKAKSALIAASLLCISSYSFALSPAIASSVQAATTSLTPAANPAAIEADALIKSIVSDVVDSIKKQKIGKNDTAKIIDLVDKKIMPHADLETTTKMVLGQHWAKATLEQRKVLMQEFKKMLILTYAGALTKVENQTINYKPLRALPTDTKVIVKSSIVEKGEEKPIDYRLHKVNGEWKVYDINVLGIGLVASFRPDFNEQANKPSGIDGLIAFLQNKNKI